MAAFFRIGLLYMMNSPQFSHGHTTITDMQMVKVTRYSIVVSSTNPGTRVAPPSYKRAYNSETAETVRRENPLVNFSLTH